MKEEIKFEDNNCFVCGINNPIGLKAIFKKGDGISFCKIKIPYTYQGWNGIVHGGIIASLLDDAMIYACNSLGYLCVTAEINIKYSKPLPVLKNIEINAEVEEIKKKIIFTKSKLLLDGEIIAKATAKMFINITQSFIKST